MPSLSKNFLFNIILTISNYIFPLITYPYVSRVLGVSNIGICYYIDSIINYVMLFSMMGISYVGLREIAQTKYNQEELNKAFSNIFYLNICLCIASLIIFNTYLLFNESLWIYKDFIYLGELKIILNIFLIEWFYQGIENFKYITLRSIATKTIYVILVICFVRKPDDAIVYYALSVILIAGNFVFNWFHKKKFVKLQIKGIQAFKYFKQSIIMGGYTILTSVYSTFNLMILGFISGTTQVGYYATSIKILEICIALFMALTKAMLPRISSLIKENNIIQIKKHLASVFELLFIFSIPVMIFGIIFAPNIITILAGSGYEGSIIPMRILMCMILPVGIDQILILQILMPFKKDKQILRNTTIASLFSGIGLIVLLKPLASIGSAIILLSAELLIMCLSIYTVKKQIGIPFPFQSLKNRIIYAIPYLIISLLSIKVNTEYGYLIAIPLYIIWFYCENILLKETILAHTFNQLKKNFLK